MASATSAVGTPRTRPGLVVPIFTTAVNPEMAAGNPFTIDSYPSPSGLISKRWDVDDEPGNNYSLKNQNYSNDTPILRRATSAAAQLGRFKVEDITHVTRSASPVRAAAPVRRLSRSSEPIFKTDPLQWIDSIKQFVTNAIKEKETLVDECARLARENRQLRTSLAMLQASIAPSPPDTIDRSNLESRPIQL